MTGAFVDTDVIIRLLTGDDVDKQQAAAELFAAVEQRRLRLQAPVTVIADAVYVLSSPRLYAVPRTDIRDILQTIIRLPGFMLDPKPALLRALEIYADSRLDFGDAFILASMEHAAIDTLYSFDRDFDGFHAVQRLEPAA